MKQNLRNRVDEANLVNFARLYLAESFPNPDRLDCPPSTELRRLAEQPTSADLSVTEHLGSCSPCFEEYQELLVETRKKIAATHRTRCRSIWWAYAALAGAALVGLTIVWFIGYPSRLNLPREAVLDLRDMSSTRGPNGPARNELPRVKRVTQRLMIYLPIGLEGSYQLKVFDEGRRLVVASTGNGTVRDSLVVVAVDLDLSRERPGIYSFELRRNSEFMRVYEVHLE